MARVIARVAAALVMSVVAASCAGGDDDPPAQSTTLASTAPSTTTTPTSAPAAAPRLDLHGLGPVRVGMTVAEAAAALGVELKPATAPTPACTLYAPASGGLEGVAFLVAEGVVARVDVTAGATSTAEGLTVGQSEAEAQQRYGNRLRVSDHDFLLGGHYLTLVPTTREDAGFRLVVETDGHQVTALRAGRLPEVDLTEGCA